MRKHLFVCLLAASAFLGAGMARADEATVSDGTTAEAVVDPVPVDEGSGGDLPTSDVLGGETPTLYTDPPAEDVQPVVVDEPAVVEEPVVVEEKPPVDEAVSDGENVVSEEQPVAVEDGQLLEGGPVPVEGGGTAELVTTTSAGGEEGAVDPQVMYQTSGPSTRGPEGCMECRTLTGAPENMGPEAPAPEVTADVIDDNAMPASPARNKRNAANP